MEKHPVNRMIDIIEDHHTLADCLYLIASALESGERPRILPTLNDDADEATLRLIFDLIEKRKEA